ncbi:MAG: Restriction endonuclease subunit R [uncultured Thiotrichaceae bacterium]|uniref:Restriction endonuclease subunit R n=1 Tax=uncultured Thiotrichaceae bacterium TaxID=298394 RepID=A0A6S6TSR9_9GAMM|nr:MAG: Restriction endonuclease subunit R [uncultured Thiotrichaceae bacterium]
MRFEAKTYQQQVLDSTKLFFRQCHLLPNPSVAFNAVTEELWGNGLSYNKLEGFPADMPYFCLRIPTGGGKTWLAAKSVQSINRHLLRSDYSVILWLVPSRQIRDQTLKGLRDHQHPLHAALREAGDINVLDLDEAKSMTRATLDTSTTVIVATRQAFQVEDTESRKVYESSGALMHHFEHLSAIQKTELLNDGETMPYSLANALRLRRPFVIVDEAHNSRTELGFDTLAKFRPAGIMELTATPDLVKTPSNVLHSISASELKAEEMIKLPIRLETEPDWQHCLADAIARRGELQTVAVQEQREGEAYLRPVVLIQAEARRKGIETRDVYQVKQELIDNHNIPDDEIIIATGQEKGLEQIDTEFKKGIADPDCPVKYIITQKALAEGWDCPSAYILVSIASLHSSTAVEQILGRVLRQPGAKQRTSPLLNQSYAFVVSRSFSDTASALRDRLVTGAGFERKNVQEFVQAANPDQGRLDLDGGKVTMQPIQIQLVKKPDLKVVTKPVKDKVTWDNKKKTLTITQPLSVEETQELKTSIDDFISQQAIEEAAEISRTSAIEVFTTPAEQGEVFRIPQLAVQLQGELQLFDDPELLEYPWDLSIYDAHPVRDELMLLDAAMKVSEGGEIDISDEGKITTTFIADLQRDLGLAYQPEHWDETKVSAWLCQNIPEESITHENKIAFVAAWVRHLLDVPDYDIARLNQQKFFIRDLIEQRITHLRKSAVTEAYQTTLFGDESGHNLAVNDTYSFTFNPQVYSPSSYYDPNTSKHGYYNFKKHYYGQIGDFDSGEEFECACWLDQQAEKGRVKFWVRNLVRKEGCSFFLQKAVDRFYPDYICVLPNDSILVIEYKGADKWSTDKVKADRNIGNLWASLSHGKCQFVMVKNKEWEQVNDFLS